MRLPPRDCAIYRPDRPVVVDGLQLRFGPPVRRSPAEVSTAIEVVGVVRRVSGCPGGLSVAIGNFWMLWAVS